jgi:isocitrate dehydrogenase kinase/phosphatase
LVYYKIATWNNVSLKAKLNSSNAWIARAIFRLASDLGNVNVADAKIQIQVNDDKLFFRNLKAFFADNGFFTDRQIGVARQKMRDNYVDYLVTIANQ